MTVTINGTTGIDQIQSGVVQQSDLGSNVAGNGPAVFTKFTGTTVNPTVLTTLTINIPEFDVSGSMSTSTGKFTPNVPGYYQCNAAIYVGGVAVGGLEVHLLKNTTGIAAFAFGSSDTAPYKRASCSGLAYMNGTTDYIVVGGYSASSAFTATGSFSCFLARAA